jgi:hypothetical protein
VGWCRRLGALRPQRWWGGPKWIGGGFGFDQRFVWSLHLGGDFGWFILVASSGLPLLVQVIHDDPKFDQTQVPNWDEEAEEIEAAAEEEELIRV